MDHNEKKFVLLKEKLKAQYRNADDINTRLSQINERLAVCEKRFKNRTADLQTNSYHGLLIIYAVVPTAALIIAAFIHNLMYLIPAAVTFLFGIEAYFRPVAKIIRKMPNKYEREALKLEYEKTAFYALQKEME